MKKFLAVLLATVLALGIVACGSKGDSGSGSDVKGEKQTGGNITVLVPENMSLTQGDLLDKSNPDAVSISETKNALKYIQVFVKEETAIDDSMDMTREVNSECTFKDVTIGNFSGYSYDSNGINCIQLKGKVGDKNVQIAAAYFDNDDEILKAVIDSVEIK